MSAVEIEEAVSDLVHQPFDPEEFPFSFLEAYGNKATTIKRLRKGNTNKSSLPGGVLQRSNIHLAVCGVGEVSDTLQQLLDAPETTKQKAKFILATDGQEVQAENLSSGDTLACAYADLDEHFTFFFELAGISTVKEIRESTFDIKATGRLNKLYLELLRHNPQWATAERRTEMNHFMARLIFCFFAEDTSIFNGENAFTGTIEKMSEPDGSNTHEIIAECFRSMNTDFYKKEKVGIRVWARSFRYVNGELFSGSNACPRFTRIALTYLLHVGKLNWKQINPDIFGSMIQAVADEEERSSLGMHYTSVPNILKVLNPLFLDELHEQLAAAGDNSRKLANLRRRISRIRVFDPACGSGNFLVIAYKRLREIEYEINQRRDEKERKSEIPLTNFRGIELKSFSAEIARLALVIAEFQCDVLYLGHQFALKAVLPLGSRNWITCGNALRIDWLSVCPPTGESVEMRGDDLFSKPTEQAEVEFENAGGETFICGNPPYKGRNKKGESEKKDTKRTFSNYKGSFASLDYVANWLLKAAEYCKHTNASAALVATNSVCQGEQVALLWPIIFNKGLKINFAHTSFNWSNLASDKAGVTVVVIGITPHAFDKANLYTDNVSRIVDQIGPYLVPGSSVIVKKRDKPVSGLSKMYLGNMAKCGGNLIMTKDQAHNIAFRDEIINKYLRNFYGSAETIQGQPRVALWIEDQDIDQALGSHQIRAILAKVRDFRLTSKAASTRKHGATPHKFVQLSASAGNNAIVIPRVSSENRPYLPVDYLGSGPIIGDKCYVIYDKPLWHLAIIVSVLHIVWIGTVCSRLRNDYSYGNKLGWNTFPLPTLTANQKADLTRCAEEILLARERHFPATIADLYDPEKMPEDLRRAHDRNDEVLERIYIGRRFRNDTERLEKLFELYTEMTA